MYESGKHYLHQVTKINNLSDIMLISYHLIWCDEKNTLWYSFQEALFNLIMKIKWDSHELGTFYILPSAFKDFQSYRKLGKTKETVPNWEDITAN